MGSSALILAGVGAYLLGVLGVGLVAARRVRDNADYIVAGHRLGPFLATATLFATWFGGGTALGASGAAYAEGLLGVVADPLGAALCLFVFGRFFAAPLRRLELLTVADFFRVRFGRAAEALSAVCILPAYLGWVGSQLVAFGFILNVLTGVDTTLAIAVGAAVVIAYTMAGGLWAVTITDVVQGVVLALGLAVLAAVLVAGEPSLPGRIPAERLRLLPDPTARDAAAWLQAWLVLGIGAIPSQDLLQRAMAARSDRVAVASAHLAGGLYLTVGMLPVGLGLLGALLLPGLDNPELVLPRLCLDHLPPLGVGLVLGALLSAIMSSADSALLAPAGILSENVARVIRPGLSEAAVLRVSRLAVPAFGAVSLGVGLWFETVYDLMVGSWSVLMVSLLAPLTAGLYWARATPAAAIAGILSGLASWLVWSWLQDAWPADLLALGTSAGVLWLTARLQPRS